MEWTHLDQDGKARMVDVSDKPAVLRTAVARGRLLLSPATVRKIQADALPKGNPFEVARIAAIQAAKETSRLIPLCHTLNLDHVDVEIDLREAGFEIEVKVTCQRATGVEMEALTGASVAALTLYDMCKAVDKEMRISDLCVVEKTKGRQP